MKVKVYLLFIFIFGLETSLISFEKKISNNFEEQTKQQEISLEKSISQIIYLKMKCDLSLYRYCFFWMGNRDADLSEYKKEILIDISELTTFIETLKLDLEFDQIFYNKKINVNGFDCQIYINAISNKYKIFEKIFSEDLSDEELENDLLEMIKINELIDLPINYIKNRN